MVDACLGCIVHSWPTAELASRDVRDPLSLGSVHVTEETDLRGVGPWPRSTLYAVVEEAATLERIVVLDYEPEQLYVAADAEHTNGLVPLTEPLLRVEDPLLAFVDGGGAARTGQNHSISDSQPSVSLREFRSELEVPPPFDVLVPAFDLPEDDEPLPPTRPRPTRRPTGHGTGTST